MRHAKRVAEMAAATKVATDIEGFDEITYGGLPRGRTTLVMGGPGCGKTVFALQTLVNGARRWKEPGLFVAFEESADHIVANAATFGWDLQHLAKKRLFFLDARLSPEVVKAGEFDLLGMLNVLQAKADEMGAKRIVFDGIDVLLGLLDDPGAERRELYRIRDWLAKTGLTGIITQKVCGTELDGHYNYLQFMVDCVVSLRQQVFDGAAFRSLRVVKYRGSDFAADEFPISLGQAGLQLSTRGPAELQYVVTSERISSGLPRLDHMLCGGYHRGSNVLISGAPGTAKSTLAGLFIAAACARGERALFVSFDEGANQIVRNLESVAIELGRHVKSGLLEIYSTRTRGANIENQFADLRERVLAHRPRCVVIDPLSALSTTAHIAAGDASQRFLDFLKREQVTVITTSLLPGLGAADLTSSRIATVADTWIQVSNVAQDGEHNRALTIVKSRGTGHSNQVRELKLSDQGVDLADVFVAHGKVLMGVARWEREQQERATKERTGVTTELKRLQLELAQAESAARLQVIQMAMATRSAELAMLAASSGQASKVRSTDREVVREMRHADKDSRATSGNGHPKANGRTL